jgi:hypothetical protein
MLLALTWFGVFGAGGMAVYLLAVRCVSWDLLPNAVVARVRWWRRHAPCALVVSTVVAVAGGALVAWTS